MNIIYNILPNGVIEIGELVGITKYEQVKNVNNIYFEGECDEVEEYYCEVNNVDEYRSFMGYLKRNKFKGYILDAFINRDDYYGYTEKIPSDLYIKWSRMYKVNNKLTEKGMELMVNYNEIPEILDAFDLCGEQKKELLMSIDKSWIEINDIINDY